MPVSVEELVKYFKKLEEEVEALQERNDYLEKRNLHLERVVEEIENIACNYEYDEEDDEYDEDCDTDEDEVCVSLKISLEDFFKVTKSPEHTMSPEQLEFQEALLEMYKNIFGYDDKKRK